MVKKRFSPRPGPQELDLQSLVVRSIKAHGGYGFKLTNRFLNGIPDLLLQFEGVTGMWEVKKGPEVEQGKRLWPKWKSPISPIQYEVLNNLRERRACCGLIYFMIGRQQISCATYSWDKVWGASVLTNSPKKFVVLPRGHREDYIADLIRREHDRHKSLVSEPGQFPRRLWRDSEDCPDDQAELAFGGWMAGPFILPEGST